MKKVSKLITPLTLTPSILVMYACRHMVFISKINGR